MADEIEMVGLEEDANGEEEEENGDDNKMEDTEEPDLIFEAGSDIDEEEPPQDDDEKKDDKPVSVPQTKRDTEFTSEDFKIELNGLPRYYAMGQLKKLLNETLQLKAHKIKPAGVNKDWAYITFRDEKSRTKALAVLDEYNWKKCTLTCSIAKAIEDPVAAKVNQSQGGDDSKFLEGEDPDSKIPIMDRVLKSVTPLAHRTYEDQLKEKQAAALAALKKLGREMSKTNPELKQFIKFHKQRRKGQVCEVGDIIPSPVTEGYRNKCEFTVGINPEDELPTVGFRVSSYKSGSLAVGPVEHLVHIPDSMKSVVKVFQEFVRDSEHKPFSPLTHEGVWRQLTVRTSAHDDVLIAVVVHPQEFTEEQMGDIKQSVVDFFKDGGGASVGVTSIFFQAYGQKAPGPEETEAYEHLWGEKYITETVLGKTFRISCESFFQVNTKACEVLYDTIGDLAELDGTSVILDVCCGTGTIGISLADQCVKVYGIEMVKKAAEDARHNAELNGLENVAIYTGKAEINMNPVLAQCVKYNTIGVVDPPRAGLAESVVRALRKCDNMNRLIYMSCDPEGAFKNFVDLTRPKSKNYKGEFFVPIKAAIVDMFPHTKHYELLIVFERWEERKWRRIIEGSPLPRDQEYFDRIPPKPEGADEESSDEEVVTENTGMGTWTSIAGRNRRDNYQPYRNPRREFGDDRQQRYRGGAYGGGGGDGNGYGSQSLMGRHPYEDMHSGGGSGGGRRGPPSSSNEYYNEDRYSSRMSSLASSSMLSRMAGSMQSYGRSDMQSYGRKDMQSFGRRDMQSYGGQDNRQDYGHSGMESIQDYGHGGMDNMQDYGHGMSDSGGMMGYQEGPSDPYRLHREEWDRDVPFTPRYGGPNLSGRARKKWY